MTDRNKSYDWVIYKITSPSGRVYMGKSICLDNRLSSYKTLNCKSQPKLYNSLVKYGYDNHSLEVIDSFFGDNLFANGKEMFWIRSYMSNSNKWVSTYSYDKGLNLTDGAEGMTGYKYSEESKRKMSIAGRGKPKYKLRGRPMSEETKRKLSEKGKLRPSPNLGKKLSEERKRQIGVSKVGNKYMLGKSHSEETRKKIAETRAVRYGNTPILVYDLNMDFIAEYPSKREAHRETGVARNVINNNLRGVTSQTPKLIFKYKG